MLPVQISHDANPWNSVVSVYTRPKVVFFLMISPASEIPTFSRVKTIDRMQMGLI